MALSCHPLPCLAVTAFATGYALLLGATPGRAALVAAAALAGQLCVGFTNDAFDAERDRVAGRRDKPLARGEVGVRAVWTAAALAGVATVPLSLALGLTPGLLHLVAVTAALGYDLWLKWTVLSPVPYVVSFGLLPVVAATAVAPGEWPPAGHVLAAALLGAGAHFGNTVGDTEADRATGVRGLPQRLGPARSLVAMAGLVALAAAVLLATTLGGEDVSGRRLIAVLASGGGVLLATAVAALRVGLDGGRLAWRLTLAAVGLVVVGFVLGT